VRGFAFGSPYTYACKHKIALLVLTIRHAWPWPSLAMNLVHTLCWHGRLL